jgi:serine/threonine protein phosphatase PrpC
VDVAVGTELGLLRCTSSDAHVAEAIAPSVAFVGIADGFGEVGRGGGPTAPLALATIRDHLRRRSRMGVFARNASPSGVRAAFLAALDHANARLYSQSGSNDDFVSSGTSLTAVLIVAGHAFVGHVGDARAYLLRLGRLELLTADDAMFADAAVTSSKSALPLKPRTSGLLWRSLGTQAKLEASIAHVELLPGDQLVLCTDGVHRCIGEDELADALASCESASDVVAQILGTAKARGNVDTGTLLVGRDLLTTSVPARDAAARRLRPLRVTLALAAIAAMLCSFGAYALRLGSVDHPTNVTTTNR